ncbi:hypothetical protein [Streptomyces sp. NPDC057002]|uniref:hypothetical protein n=1 Tax=Streptomyces sp. NPDC057002 TaxID=3345992 RepID=UPI00362F13B5
MSGSFYGAGTVSFGPPAPRTDAKPDTRSHKAKTHRVDYRGKINLRGERTGAKVNAPHARHTGKNLRTPKRHIVSDAPKELGNSPTYAPGSFTRGMGHDENSGYEFLVRVDADSPIYDRRVIADMRAARDYALKMQRSATGIARDTYSSKVRELRRIVRTLEKEHKGS